MMQDPQKIKEIYAVLKEIWMETLPLVEFSSDQNFFECGGNSLGATRLTAEAERRLGVNIEISTLFDYPVFHDLAASIAETVSPRST